MALEVESDALRETVSFPLVDKCSSPTWCSQGGPFFLWSFSGSRGATGSLNLVSPSPFITVSCTCSIHAHCLAHHTCILSCTCSIHAHCLAHAAYMHIVLHMKSTCQTHQTGMHMHYGMAAMILNTFVHVVYLSRPFFHDTFRDTFWFILLVDGICMYMVIGHHGFGHCIE